MRPEPFTANHTCGYYCVDGSHAVEATATADVTAAQVQAGYNRYLHPHGWRVASVREAPEADPAAWHAQMGWKLHPREAPGRPVRVTRPVTALADHRVCWLVFIVPQEEDA
jgi:hypothetical protein